jgi:hypothetical protein
MGRVLDFGHSRNPSFNGRAMDDDRNPLRLSSRTYLSLLDEADGKVVVAVGVLRAQRQSLFVQRHRLPESGGLLSRPGGPEQRKYLS